MKSVHVFTFLMLLSGLSAFVIPPAKTQRFKPNVQALFLPVSWPASGLGKWLAGRMGDRNWNDTRDADTIKAENAELRAEVSNLTERLRRELDRTAQRERLSPRLRDRGDWLAVVGGDAGTRQTLSVRGPVPAGVVNGLYAIYSGGVVGSVQNVGPAGAHVRLVTDVGFRVRCGFARLQKNAQGRVQMVPIEAPPVVVEGAGDNTLRVVKTGLTIDDAKKAGLIDAKTGKALDGLWAFVDDRDWPEVFKGQAVGQVERIGPREDYPLFADVVLHPATNLSRLREVLVVTKE